MGLLDDWMDLKWRYKAFMPLIAALPLIYLAIQDGLRTSITLPLIGVVQFYDAYYFLVIPLIVMVVTNTVNQLGGLNGLETVCPAIILIGLMVLSQSYMILMLGPLVLLACSCRFKCSRQDFRRQHRFIRNRNDNSFFRDNHRFEIWDAIFDFPYIFNSSLILLTIFLSEKERKLTFDGKKLVSYHRRSLVTLITYHRPLTERQVVAIISLLIAVFVLIAVLIELQWSLLT
jgi:UDP-N-acetylmuramyl pentapeptide phosphotransferase/UDP-N-acetylglucosamine-1-phosphate transferase